MKKILTKEEEDKFIHEMILYSQLHNPAILQLIKFSLFSYDPKFFPAFLTEYMVNESLGLFFEKECCGVFPKEFTNSKKYIILLGIISGMKYLHSQGLIHRNLNPTNILLDENFYPKICNFFFQKKLNISKLSNEFLIETLFYIAPEILSNQPATFSSDTYSFGMIFYRLLTKKSPFEKFNDTTHFLKAIKNNKRPDLTNIEDESIRTFLSQCWSSIPSERPTFDSILTEISKEKYKRIFNANESEVRRYITLFNDSNNSTISNINNNTKFISDEVFDYQSFNEKLFNEKPSEALKYFKQLADKGDPNAMYNYANMKQNGFGCKVDKPEAAKYYKMGADCGHPNSMYNLGLMYHSGDGIERNKEEAARYYKKAAKKGDNEAMFNYAVMSSLGDGIPMNKKEAAFYYKISADLGNTDSMLNYGVMLEKGDGIQMNKKEAARYYKMSADKGNDSSMLNYGIMLNLGSGIEQNKKESARYYKMSADKGNKIAMLNYAIMNLNGDGIPINKKESAKYMKMSADAGDADAMLYYASILYNGDGVPVNKKESAKYFKMSADHGNTFAMQNYAMMLNIGDGVDSDKNEAARYMNMSKK